MTPLLYTTNLTVGYRREGKDNILFEKLALEIMSGQVICFMGPNGVGKSTLIRTLAGLQQAISGKIVLEKETPSMPSDIPKKIAVVLTDKVSGANLTVEELITYGRYPYMNWTLNLTDEDKAIIAKSIKQLRLSELVHKKIYELSDGQFQMAMIARALAQDTKLILLDEPTSHLDLNNRVEIMNLLRQIAHDTNKGVLMATHELDLALQTADLIWLAGKDQDIIRGVPEDLVLSDVFDDVFQFKGFDLKTGKVLQHVSKKLAIKLSGAGHHYLWTRNALERNGYEVTDDGIIEVSIRTDAGKPTWSLGTSSPATSFQTIEALLAALQMMEHDSNSYTAK